MIVVVGLNNGDDFWGPFCNAMPALASASLMMGLLGSEFCLCSVFSTIGNKFSGEICVAIICGSVNCCDNRSFCV